MNKELKLMITFINNVACKYLNSKVYIEDNLKENT